MKAQLDKLDLLFQSIILQPERIKIESLHSKSLIIKSRTQPVPAPDSAKEPTNNNINEGGNNQKEILLSLGNQFSIRNLLHIWTMSSSNFSRVRAKRR